MFTFENGRPEEFGIPREAVKQLEAAYQRLGVRMHGYMLIGGKKILAERYWEPYNAAKKHRMYSVTKSFVAVAVGILLKKGMIRLSDRICDYFPEKLPEEGAHPWCAEMTIEDLLSMRTCYEATTFKAYDGEDWTESFFRVKPTHVPGTVFHYDTSASHVLAALVEKLTGMSMLDYMRAEMLDELGFSKDAYILTDPVGVSQGGSGLMCTLRDVACVAYVCNHFGVANGRSFLPSDYIQSAVSCQVPTDLQPTLDEQMGYGYFMWMPREEGFVFYGMGGQLAVCFPKLDFIYMTMADTIGNPAGLQLIYDCFYHTVYPHLKERREENPLAFTARAIENAAKYERLQEERRKETQNRCFDFYPNKLMWSSLTFDWKQQKLHFTIPAGEFTFTFGAEAGVKQPFLNTGYECMCQGYWKMGHFILKVYLTDEEQGNVRMEFAWKDNRLSLRAEATNDPFVKEPAMKRCFHGFAAAKGR